jgi:DNA polymerase-3 subunit epsilon
MYLIFDTETSDLPRRWDAPATDTKNWPRLVQLCWVVCESDVDPVDAQSRLIRPEGFRIVRSATEIHGITTQYAEEHGVPLRPVLDEFVAALKEAHEIVAHNIGFDARVMGAELIRAGLPDLLADKPQRCTMKESTDFCKLPGKYGFKWPSLTELHEILFDEPVVGAHDATADCLACMRCFFELQRRGAIKK